VKRPPAALVAVWRAKLVASGFVDQERPDGSLRHCGPREGWDPETGLSGNGHHALAGEYYDLLEAEIASPRFTEEWSPKQRAVIVLHAQGTTHAQIRKVLRCAHTFDVKTVAEFRRRVGIRG